MRPLSGGNYTVSLALGWPAWSMGGAGMKVPSSDDLNVLH